MAYIKYFNSSLRRPSIKVFMNPINSANDELFSNFDNGMVLCQLVEIAFPDTINRQMLPIHHRHYTATQKLTNFKLGICAAACNGAPVLKHCIEDYMEQGEIGKRRVIDTIWQIIKCGLFRHINLYEHQELYRLKKADESIVDFKCVPPEQMIIRYVNYHLQYVNANVRLSSIDEQLADGEIYAHLLDAVAPVTLRGRLVSKRTILQERELRARVTSIMDNLNAMEAGSFLSVSDFMDCNQHKGARSRLHLATLAQLLLDYPGELLNPVWGRHVSVREPPDRLTLRNFANCCGVQPFVTHTYENMRDGLITRQLFEAIDDGTTAGIRFNTEFPQPNRDALFIQNNTNIVQLNQSVELGVPDLDAQRLAHTDELACRNVMLALARTKITTFRYRERVLLQWVNEVLDTIGYRFHLQSFSDPNLLKRQIFILVLAQITGVAYYRDAFESDYDAAQYTITRAHMAGYLVYTRPEHFVECNGEFIALAFSALMWG